MALDSQLLLADYYVCHVLEVQEAIGSVLHSTALQILRISSFLFEEKKSTPKEFSTRRLMLWQGSQQEIDGN